MKKARLAKKKLEFVFFCIEYLAERLHISGDVAYRLLTKDSDILDSFVIPFYDPLHTQGKEYIVDRLLEVLTKRGVAF